MSTYIILINLTDKGIKNVNAAPAQIKAAAAALEAAGGKLLNFYAVLGQYDHVAIVECPSDEVVTAQLLELGARGNVRTVTLKAFKLHEVDGWHGRVSDYFNNHNYEGDKVRVIFNRNVRADGTPVGV